MLRHGVKMPVNEYRKFEWHPLYKEATEKYAGQVKLSPNGCDIVNYVAGAPFPGDRADLVHIRRRGPRLRTRSSGRRTGTIKVEDTKTTKPPSYPFERLGSWHGGVVDMQLNHASKWDAPDAYMYPNPGIKHAYADEPKEWNTPDTFTLNYLIKSAGF